MSTASGTSWPPAKPSSQLLVRAPTASPSPRHEHWHMGGPLAGGFAWPQHEAEGWELSVGLWSIPPAEPGPFAVLRGC